MARQRPSGRTVACSRRSLRCSPRPTIACRTGAEAARATGLVYVSARRARDGRGPGPDRERGGNVVEREGPLVGGTVPSAASSPAGRPLSRKRARKPGAPVTPYPWGFVDARDRPRSRAAEQIRAAPGRRRHARRRAVRFSRRKPGAGADHDARGGGGPARLADHARAGRQQRARSARRRRKTRRATSSAPRR